MRPGYAAAAAAILLATAGAIVAGGRAVAPPVDEITIAPEDIPTAVPGMDDEATGQDDASSTAVQPAPGIASQSSGRSRAIDPEVVAPPATGEAPLERTEPRPPLSNLSLALPPKPKAPGEWKDKPLFQPVATAAGLIEAKGHTIAISGIDVVKPDETCTDTAGKSWSCGLAARTAFRAFLRGRAITCAAPAKGGPGTAAAACSVGKQDLGHWLVENGWARALKTGPYADAGEAANKAKKGIFGTAPDLSGLPPLPVEAPPTDLAEPSPSILDLSGTAATPPDDPSTQQAFPPAPAQ